MKIAKSLTELIGNTPLLELSNLERQENLGASVAAKLESFNPLSSAKDRVGAALIEDAEQRGLLKHYRPIRAGATARPAFQRHCARVGRIEPGEDIQQRRLATSRSPDQGQYATTGNSNRYARQYKP